MKNGEFLVAGVMCMLSLVHLNLQTGGAIICPTHKLCDKPYVQLALIRSRLRAFQRAIDEPSTVYDTHTPPKVAQNAILLSFQ